MNTIYMLSRTGEPNDLFDDFAQDADGLKQIALDNYWASTNDVVHVEVRPPDQSNIVRISEGGIVLAEYHIIKFERVSK